MDWSASFGRCCASGTGRNGAAGLVFLAKLLRQGPVAFLAWAALHKQLAACKTLAIEQNGLVLPLAPNRQKRPPFEITDTTLNLARTATTPAPAVDDSEDRDFTDCDDHGKKGKGGKGGKKTKKDKKCKKKKKDKKGKKSAKQSAITGAGIRKHGLAIATSLIFALGIAYSVMAARKGDRKGGYSAMESSEPRVVPAAIQPLPSASQKGRCQPISRRRRMMWVRRRLCPPPSFVSRRCTSPPY